ncbi:MAG: hypothetical protein RLZZ318_293 [Bacteroidota bacterium]|jgi:UMF1 family MFS transporter
MSDTSKNNPRVLSAWCMYDWANSVFPLTITSAIFPVYWNKQTKAGIDVLGMHLTDSILFAYCLSFAYIIIALINPILSGVADNSGNKKQFMKAFVYLGALSCFGMYFFDQNHIYIGVLTFILGSVGYAGSIVFYNAYLPEIATEDRFDRLSARGFAMGYIGGVLLLVLNLLIILMPQLLFDVEAYTQTLWQTHEFASMADAQAKAKSYFAGMSSRIAFVTVGVWWLLFSLIPFYYLPKSNSTGAKISFKKGYQEMRKVWHQLKQMPVAKRFLGAFFFYSMGVQTVMYVAATFADKELKMPSDKLIMTILLIQLIAIVGAYAFSKLSQRIGNIHALLLLNLIWIGVCFAAYFVYSVSAFYILAAVVGSIMGGIQSLSRSSFAKMIPANSSDTTSFFSFYEFSEKVAIAIGVFVFGAIEHIMRHLNGSISMRYSVLSLMLFFMVGTLLLFGIRKKSLHAN